MRIIDRCGNNQYFYPALCGADIKTYYLSKDNEKSDVDASVFFLFLTIVTMGDAFYADNASFIWELGHGTFIGNLFSLFIEI